ncbi:carbon-nitrogen hydrolase family protein [Streptomyces physcomitrii]|uniref:Carbon-nitrogen hydrolase family protein n=1 Tax=Streptomyces physcomitrii TaxID=2724184 RepID=A0ABX1H9P1_9ACTN|nr:carbon-nitrogen hydrolase family protein [Streptomyces physcomitrii]NKI43954.1 carbon-nitrogen hydrolase family protein [Streptomyces physcomitrii]
MPALRAALLQSSGRPGFPADNLKLLDEAAARAAAEGAALLAAPELYLTGYAIGEEVARLAEPADGPGARGIAEIAVRHGLAVAYGYPERAGTRLYNSAQLIGPTGERLANYRKTHLYGEYEQRWFTPGEQLVVQAEFGGLRLGLLVCYDVEFPENVRAHALSGTDLLLVPTALMEPYRFVARSVVPVRAFENQLYLAYVNRTGTEGEFTFTGYSSLSGPSPAASTCAGPGEELLLADVDPALLAASRAANPYLADRRPELYGPGH